MSDLPKYELTVEGVDQALTDLDKGGSEDVAIRLEELGIRGQLDNDCGCPIANYLLRVLPGVDYVQVGGDAAYVQGWAATDGFSVQVILRPELPDSLAAFVEDFDNSVYPALIEPVQEVSFDADVAV